MIAASPQTLDEQLRNYGSLVSLVLVFIILFTNLRWATAAQLKLDQPSGSIRLGALGINLVLLLVTGGLFATGVPLATDALQDPKWLMTAGAIRDAFALVWLLLAGLLLWQVRLVARSARSWLLTSQRWRNLEQRLQPEQQAPD